MQLRLVADFAATHHGLVHRRAASERGLSTSAWYRAIAAHQVEQLYPNVVRLLGVPLTFEQRALAAVWACGEGAVSSHRTSAALWGMPRPDNDPIDVLLGNKITDTLARIDLPKLSEQELRHHLDTLGLRHANLFPDIDNYVRDLRGYYKWE